MRIKEIQCQSAISKCGFPGGGLSINPYIGCEHDCAYCYARFMKRFTGHGQENWGSFVDAKVNIAEVLSKQMKSPHFSPAGEKNKKRNGSASDQAFLKWQGQQIYIGTVTDPYQPAEAKYKLTRKILEVLAGYKNPVSVLTKSTLVWRDLDLLKKMKKVDVNFTIATLNENWKKVTEPHSPSAKQRLETARKLTQEGITVYAMMGPYWPRFTNPEVLFKEFKKVGIKKVFTESFNTVGGNWTGVDKVLQKKYPELRESLKETLFDPKQFQEFYQQEREKVEELSKLYHLPVEIRFSRGHGTKLD